jgi:hypothetical protein
MTGNEARARERETEREREREMQKRKCQREIKGRNKERYIERNRESA